MISVVQLSSCINSPDNYHEWEFYVISYIHRSSFCNFLGIINDPIIHTVDLRIPYILFLCLVWSLTWYGFGHSMWSMRLWCKNDPWHLFHIPQWTHRIIHLHIMTNTRTQPIMIHIYTIHSIMMDTIIISCRSYVYHIPSNPVCMSHHRSAYEKWERYPHA